MSIVLWTLHRSAAYLLGKGVTFGQPFIPNMAINNDIYSMVIGLIRAPGVAALDERLSVIADSSLDHVLVTPVLEGLLHPETLLTEASKKLKVGGHLVLVVREGHDQPGFYNFSEKFLKDTLGEAAHWRIKDEQRKDDFYLLILKKVEGRRGIDPAKAKPEQKRACVVRYGALGDAIVMTPLLRKLKEDGYHVTVNISRYCASVFENNPYIDNIILQEKDMVPNTTLGEYWASWEKEYDKYVNLSESIEGDLLMVEGRDVFFTSKKWRHAKANRNYYDYTLVRAGYPEVTGQKGELFFTAAEERRATKFFENLRGRFVILWALNGSSHHKVYPLMEATLREFFLTHPDATVITVGDYTAKLLEFDHPQMIQKAGEWKIRESLIATKYVNCVVGPETMMTNAAGCYSTPKITLLSHSTHENLCKYWENDYCLTPDVEIAQCYPCHQLHYTKESCPKGEVMGEGGQVLVSAPICALAIKPEVLLKRLEEVYQKHFKEL